MAEKKLVPGEVGWGWVLAKFKEWSKPLKNTFSLFFSFKVVSYSLLPHKYLTPKSGFSHEARSSVL